MFCAYISLDTFPSLVAVETVRVYVALRPSAECGVLIEEAGSKICGTLIRCACDHIRLQNKNPLLVLSVDVVHVPDLQELLCETLLMLLCRYPAQ